MRKLNFFIAVAAICGCSPNAPVPYGPVPTPDQLAWQKMEMNMFCHFGPNTFSGMEWGEGTEPEDIFNPSAMNCNQWVDVARTGGFKGIIITAKHHDGFCLWPNPVSRHTVAGSSWKSGKGDVLGELAEACKSGGIKFGVYISPWDRYDPAYGTEEYNEIYRKTLENVYSRYGNIFEQWFDGANGEGQNGKRQVYDWPLFHRQIRSMQPHTVMFSDIGPDCRWVGNERGEAGRTNWSRLDTEGFGPGSDAPSVDTLNTGNIFGQYWVPVEADVSLRKGWFWHSDDAPKTLQELLHIYYSSVGRNAVLLLNVPPDNRGLICKEDSLRIAEFRSALDNIFKVNLAVGAEAFSEKCRGCGFEPDNVLDGDYDSYWATKDNEKSASITIGLRGEKKFNRILLQEYVPLGQRVEAFHIEAQDSDGNWRTIADETTIGYKRIVMTEDCTSRAVRIVIDKALACPAINNVGIFFDEILQ